MKSLHASLLLLCISSGVCAQGTIIFANRYNGAFAPVGDLGGGLLAGPDYSVQLYAGYQGTPENSLRPVGPVLLLGTGPDAGSWPATEFAIPGIAPGAIASLQARAWLNGGGLYTSYEESLRMTSWTLKSPVFESLPLGGYGIPPAASPVTIGNPNPINNILPFSLIPEPSSVALGALWGAMLWLVTRRRR